MCRCTERGEIITDAVKALVAGDIRQVTEDASAFARTIRDDATDIARMSQAALSSAMARLGGFR